jgi:cyclophilin family peptidyl-prolyl cis-trans isomerase
VPVPAEARAFPAARLLRVKTSRGELVIELRPDVAPLTGSALAALARRGFYGGLTFHRVVPDFVVQGGDPRGDGDGGPDWALPDEQSPLHFLRGTMGIATNGAETGGSQFFLCHSPQPHLDGRYTVAGQLRPGEDVLDALQPGDTIESATAE